MFIDTRAMLAAPLVAMAVVPVGAFAALLAPFPPRGSGLLARQNGEVIIPQQCDSQCNPIINTINDCPTAECACTSQNMNSLLNCMECAVSVEPNELPDTQGLLFDFAQNCAENGVTLTVPTVTAEASRASPTPTSPNGPTGTATTNNGAPPTGVPLSFGKPAGSGTAGTAVAASSPALGGDGGGATPTTKATTTPSTSGAMRVLDRAEVLSMVFGLCLAVVLVLGLS